VKQNILRAKLKFKREALNALGYTPERTISITRLEKSQNISSEIIGTYSEQFSAEIYDPRNTNLSGHYFNSRKVFLLHNVILEPLLGSVYSKDGELIRESTNWPFFQFYHSFPWTPKKQLQKSKFASAIFLPSSAFGHWLMEDLPLVIFALETDLSAPILVASDPPKYVADFLAILDREVIYLDGPVFVDSLILVQKNQDSGWPHPKDLETLLQFAPFRLIRSDLPATKRIYASRRNAKRSPKNEHQVEQSFMNFGFEIMHLEKLDLLDEIELLSSTSTLAGVHGSALSNVIWMPPQSRVIDIVNENYWTEAGHRLCFLRNSYYNFHLYSGKFQDEVCIPEIEKLLKKHLSI
jgi:hypothetical protein